MKVDIIGLKEYLNCDNTFLKSMIEKFISEVKDIIKTIDKAAADENWITVKLNAHKMLSSVKIFEIDELVILLEKIEMSAEAKNNIPELKQDIKKLADLVGKAILDMQIASEELN